MPVDMSYFRAIQDTTGIRNETEYQREDAKDNLRWQLLESVNCEHDAKVNGQPQVLIVTKTDNVRVMNVTALPGERLLQGDLCEFYGHHWIIVRLYATDNIQMTGRAYQCNHLFRFQLGTSEIYERWGVLDSGVYSTTEKSSTTMILPDQQFKLYMQADDITRQIARDKRFAVDQWKNIEGEDILTVYRVTAYDELSGSYIYGHLIEFKLRADEYIPGVDDYDEMICNYIAPNTQTEEVRYW